jgi:hypothetical protein
MKLWNIRFWAASVDFLQIENAGDGYARRAYPIPVLARTVKPDPDLKLLLEAVKADVISWALAMPRVERDRTLLSSPENERVVNLRLDAALYGDSTKSFVDNCLRPTLEPGFMPHHLLHTVYTAYCKEHGYTPLGMSKFISHLRTVLPHNFVERRWSPMSEGKRNRVPAHWEYVTTVPGAFVSINPNNDGFRSSSENAPPPTDPIWVCRKSKCEEGGLMEFTDFWNPPEPPDDDGGNWGDGDNNPPIPPTPPQPYEGVQGGSRNSVVSNCTLDNPEQRQIKGVQGGSTVQPKDFGLEKSTVAVLEKIAPEISSTSISSGGQRVDTLDKKPEQAAKEPPSHTEPQFKAHVGLQWSEPSLGDGVDYSTFPHRSSDNLRAKIKLANTIKQQLLSANNKDELVAITGCHGENQVNWVRCRLLTESEREKVRVKAQTEQLNLLEQSNNREDSPQSNDPWLERENLEGIARDLDICPDRSTLAKLRSCWPPYAMNAACKLLSAEKHAQIRQWVLELNQSAMGD